MPFLRSGTTTATHCPCPTCGADCIRAARSFVDFANQFPDHTGGDVPWPVYVCLECPTVGHTTTVFTEAAWVAFQSVLAADRGDTYHVLFEPGRLYVMQNDTFAYLTYLWLCVIDGAIIIKRQLPEGEIGPCPLPYVGQHTAESFQPPPIATESVWSSLEAQGYQIDDLRQAE